MLSSWLLSTVDWLDSALAVVDFAKRDFGLARALLQLSAVVNGGDWEAYFRKCLCFSAESFAVQGLISPSEGLTYVCLDLP